MARPNLHNAAQGAAVESSTPFKNFPFRFAFAIAILSLPKLAIFIPPHLWFTSLRRPVALVVNRCDLLEWQTTTVIGAFVVHIVTRGQSSVREMTAKFKSDWFASAIPDVVGLLMLAIVIAVVWTALDRRRTDYQALNRWMRLYLRYGVATAMLSYAFIKVIPTQFGYVTPGELIRPFGQLSRMQVLWDFMAVSSGYTIFTGLVELSGAVLLFFRRTTLMGGIVLAASLINVVVIDLAYGVGAVTYALALLLLDVVILAPYLKPLSDFLVGRAGCALPAEPSASQQRWWHSRIAKAALLCLLALPLIAVNIQRRRSFFGSGRPIYGLFEVTTFIRNGHTVTPAASESETWKLVASDPRNGIDAISVQFANGKVRRFEMIDDSRHHVWTIRDKDPGQAATLSYGIRPGGIVSLDGRIGSDSVDILLHPVNVKKVFPLMGPA